MESEVVEASEQAFSKNYMSGLVTNPSRVLGGPSAPKDVWSDFIGRGTRNR